MGGGGGGGDGKIIMVLEFFLPALNPVFLFLRSLDESWIFFPTSFMPCTNNVK